MMRMQQAGVPDPELDAFYRRTRYVVDLPEGPLVLHVDVPSPGLLAVHRQFNVSCSSFMTGWNPRSVPQTAERNAAAHERLCARISALGLLYLAGRGHDPAAEWVAEESLLVPGLGLAAARRIAAELDQHAIVHAAADATPRLVWIAA